MHAALAPVWAGGDVAEKNGEWDSWQSPSIWNDSVASTASLDLHRCNATFVPLLAREDHDDGAHSHEHKALGKKQSVVTFSLATGPDFEQVHCPDGPNQRPFVVRRGAPEGGGKDAPLPLRLAARQGLSANGSILFLRSDCDPKALGRAIDAFLHGCDKTPWKGFKHHLHACLFAAKGLGKVTQEALDRAAAIWEATPSKGEPQGPLSHHAWLDARQHWLALLEVVPRDLWVAIIAGTLAEASQVPVFSPPAPLLNPSLSLFFFFFFFFLFLFFFKKI